MTRMRLALTLNFGIKAQRSRRRGFTLTELAIVLGVIGIILGSLWSVVAVVRDNIKRDQAINQTLVAVRNTRDLYMGRGYVQTPSGLGTAQALTDYLLRQGVLPPEMIRDRSATTLRADLPWGPRGASGSTVSDGTFAIDNTGVALSSDKFRVELRGLSYAHCVTMTSSLAGPAASLLPVTVVVNSGNSFDAPVALDDIADNCDKSPSGDNNKVDIVYRLRVAR